MPAPLPDLPNFDDALAAYQSGKPLSYCAAMCGLKKGDGFKERLIRLGIPIRNREDAAKLRRVRTPVGLVADFLAGESVKSLAARHGCDRNAIYRMLRDSGIDGRDRSEAMQVRWSRASPEERSRLLDAAHEASRGRRIAHSELLRHASAKAGRPRSANETTLGQMIAGMGYGVEYGVPLDIYNLDLVIAGTVAVEVFGGNWHERGRHRERFGKRSRHILDAGYSLVIVWVDQARYPLRIECAKHLATLVEITRSHPSIGRQHWVIRGDGYFLAVREDDGNEVPFITSAGRRDNRAA